MTDTLKTIGDWLGSTAGKTVLGLGTAGAGVAQNVMAYNQQKKIQDTLTNPAKLNAMVAAETQPLSQGLTTDIARSADAYGAERGLGSSPAIMKDVYAQALAPYQLQQQQQALQAVLQQLGIASRGTMPPANVASIFKALQMSPTKPNYPPLPSDFLSTGYNAPDVTPGFSGASTIDPTLVPSFDIGGPSQLYSGFTSDGG